LIGKDGYIWNPGQTNCVKIKVKPISLIQQPSKKIIEEITPPEIAEKTTENNQPSLTIQKETIEGERSGDIMEESTGQTQKQEKQGFLARIFESIKKFFIGLFK